MQPSASSKDDGCDWAAHFDHWRETHADASLNGTSGVHSGCEIVITKVASNASVTALREQLGQDLYLFRAVHFCIEGKGLLFFVLSCFGCDALVNQARCLFQIYFVFGVASFAVLFFQGVDFL